jgi:hypothetical protein
MASRTLRFFALPAEFDALVSPWAIDHSLWLVPESNGRFLEPVHAGRLNESVVGATRTYATPAQPVALPAPHKMQPAEYDMVDIVLPQLVAETLYLGVISATSIFIDSIGNRVETKIPLQVFEGLTRQLRRRLQRATFAWNIKDSEGVSAYPTIAHTLGAADFWHRGGLLRQRDVVNIAYGMSPSRVEGR